MAMTQTSINYAKVLYELHIPEQSVEESRRILGLVPQVKQVLISPVIMKKDKDKIIEKIFPEDMVNFLKVVCENLDGDMLEEIFTAYHGYVCSMQGILQASLTYVTPPLEEQEKEIKEFLCRKYRKNQVELSMIQDDSLIGGFILRAEGREADWSLRGRLNALQQKLQRR